jgi:hypothetical protein
MTASHPYLPLTSISNVFADNGFRTGFFWSADSRFQAFEQFLKNKKLDVAKDYRDIKCDQSAFQLSTETYKNMDYVHDVCTATALTDWIGADPDKPFFAIMMTAMTHYPYKTNTALKHYVDDEKQNAYLNALRIGDEAFGVVMYELAAAGKLDSTLVVLLGDHGEAFGQHGNYVHASALYEENVHIPLMFFNPQLFGGEVSPTIGGIIDIAPTVLDIVGIPAPPSWQGRSLFSTKRPDRTYFFSPWNGYLFGYREGRTKTLFNASTGAVELYDLAADPHERDNLAKGMTESRPMLGPLAAWVQYQRRFIADKIEAAESSGQRCSLRNITFDAAGTSFQGPPQLEVRVNFALVGTAKVGGIESTPPNGDDAVAELRAASEHPQSFSFDFDDVPEAATIEIRFFNDLWSPGEGGGDRNVYIANVAANGVNLPNNRYTIVNEDAGTIDGAGADLFKNGSIVIHGPFFDGCS